MINQLVKEIIEGLGSEHSDGIIRHEQYKKLDEKSFNIIKKNFNLKERSLDFIECSGCGEKLQVRKGDDGTKLTHCQVDGCRNIKTIKDEDSAYTTNLDDLSNFLIKILEIEQDKKVIESGKILYLGKVKIKDLGDLVFEVYLAKNIKNQELCKPTSKRIPSLIIKLSNRKSKVSEINNIKDCWFCDLIFYDVDLKQFSLNHRVLFDTIAGCFDGVTNISDTQKYLDSKCLAWLKNMVKCGAIRNGDKAKLRKFANDYFNTSPNKFNEIWRKEAPKNLVSGGRPSSKF